VDTDREAFGHFERYVNLLFCLTVAHEGAAIHLSRNRSQPLGAVLTGGHDPRGKPVMRLADGRFLRLVPGAEGLPKGRPGLRCESRVSAERVATSAARGIGRSRGRWSRAGRPARGR
jgi:hypothetical protein